jgi:hypothetical protein
LIREDYETTREGGLFTPISYGGGPPLQFNFFFYLFGYLSEAS